LGLIGFVGGFAMASPELRELYLEYAAPTATVSLAVVAALASAVVLLLRRRPLCLVAWTFALLAAAIQLALELGAVQSFPTSRLLWHLSALLPALLGLLHSLSLLRRGLLA
jgi:hypothetical protein